MQQGRLQFGDNHQLVEKVDKLEVVVFAELEPIHLDEADRGKEKNVVITVYS